jgi:hypothetical protein
MSPLTGSRPRFPWGSRDARKWVGTPIGGVALLTFLLALSPSALALSSSGTGRSGGAGGTSPENMVQLVALNSTVCELLQPAGEMPTSVVHDTASLFDQLCVLPQFDSLIWTWGRVANFTVNGTTYPLAANLSISWSGTVASGWVSADFAVTWVFACEASGLASNESAASMCSFQEYWNGYLANNTLVGPTTVVYPAATTGPVPGGSSPLHGIEGAPVAILLAAAGVGTGTGLTAWTRYRRAVP